jgi:hypothetical protein
MHKAPQEIALAIPGEELPLDQTRNFLGTPDGADPDAPPRGCAHRRA